MTRRERPTRKRQLKRNLGSGGKQARPELYSLQEEEARSAVVEQLGLLDTEPEERFDRICRLAGGVMEAPATYIALLDRNRQWFKSTQGMGELKETPREGTFCDYAIRRSRPTVVLNADEDPLFCKSPYVTDGPMVKFYAGFPLVVDGQRVGTLCALDFEPREEVTHEQLEKFYDLARLAEQELAQKEDDDSAVPLAKPFVGPVTFMQVTLIGSRELFTGLEPETATSVLNLYCETLIEQSRRWQASVDDLSVDGLRLLFRDQAHHSVHALACALEMQQRLGEVDGVVTAHDLPTLSLSVGLHSDEVVMANVGAPDLWRETLVSGDAKLAKKLSELGLGGAILATESTVREVADKVSLSVGPCLKVEGFEGDHRVYDLSNLVGEGASEE